MHCIHFGINSMKNNFGKIGILFLMLTAFSSVGQAKKWTLQECVEYALKNNISVLQTDLENKTALIDKKTAFGNFLPNVNANASHSWNIGLNQNITTGLLENQTTQFTSAGLSANVTIYNGLQNQYRLRKANLAILASQYQLTKIKDDISLNVANAYLQILFNKENLKVQKELLSNDEKQFTRTNELVSAGVVPRGDLLDVKATVATDKQKVVAAENSLFISKLSLAQLLQLQDFENFDIADANYEPKESTTMLEKPQTIIDKAKQDRIEIKIAKTNLELAQKDISIAKSAFQPTVSGFYNFNTRVGYSQQVVGIVPNAQNPTSVIGQVDGTGQNVIQPNFSAVLGNPDPFFDQLSNNKGQSFGVQISVPIFNGFSVKNNVERSKVAFEITEIASKQANLDLERNVYTAITDAKGAINAYEASVTSLEARSEALNYAKEKYAVGLMNSFDYNQAQTLYANAQSEVLRTKFDAVFKVKVVEFYFGIPIMQTN